jgi:hypothetical protein
LLAPPLTLSLTPSLAELAASDTELAASDSLSASVPGVVWEGADRV